MRLTLGKEKYLIPQGEVIALEPAIDIDRSGSFDGNIGVVPYENKRLPVYSLTNDLELSQTLPESRRICLCLSHDGIGFGILCDDVDNLQDVNFTVVSIPECMRTENCPVDNLAVYGNKVMNIISAESVLKLLPSSIPPEREFLTSGQKL